MKVCVKCKKEMADNPEFCPHCGNIIDDGKKAGGKWYLKTTSLIVSFLVVGPFMLPLVWMKPELSNKMKAVYTVIILILTYLIFVVFMKSIKSIIDAYQFAGAMQ